MTGALSGIRILDLTRVLAGPWATQMLADFGAEVIKIEKPGEGDDTRGWGPPFVTRDDGLSGDAAYFLAANRGKHSVCIDMAKAEGQKLIRDLAAHCDVVVENFKVGGLKKYGLDYASLKALNPALIYCSITGFGQSGPYAQRAGYDFMIQGMSGIMSITGEPDGAPMKMGVAFADIFTGLHAVIGITTALFHRSRTGEGQYIDLALLDAQVSVLANQAMNYLVGGKVPQRLGNAHPNIVPYQSFATADSHIIMAVGNDRQFTDYCQIIAHPELSSDVRYATNRARVENRTSLIAILNEAMRHRTTAEWVQAFEAKSVPCGPINTLAEVFADPQIKARNMLLTLAGENGGSIPAVANPIRFSATPAGYEKPAPARGADTTAVLQNILHLTDAEIAELKQAAVVE